MVELGPTLGWERKGKFFLFRYVKRTVCYTKSCGKFKSVFLTKVALESIDVYSFLDSWDVQQLTRITVRIDFCIIYEFLRLIKSEVQTTTISIFNENICWVSRILFLAVSRVKILGNHFAFFYNGKQCCLYKTDTDISYTC